MINKKIFFKGYKSILAHDSPAIALGCCFIAIGALLKNLGFNIQESIFSTMLTYALPGSLVMAESLLVGASLLNIFLAVWFVNARLYPMAVSLFPLMMHKNQPKWKYYFSCHFIAVSAWLIMKSNISILVDFYASLMEIERQPLDINEHLQTKLLKKYLTVMLQLIKTLP